MPHFPHTIVALPPLHIEREKRRRRGGEVKTNNTIPAAKAAKNNNLGLRIEYR